MGPSASAARRSRRERPAIDSRPPSRRSVSGPDADGAAQVAHHPHETPAGGTSRRRVRRGTSAATARRTSPSPMRHGIRLGSVSSQGGSSLKEPTSRSAGAEVAAMRQAVWHRFRRSAERPGPLLQATVATPSGSLRGRGRPPTRAPVGARHPSGRPGRQRAAGGGPLRPGLTRCGRRPGRLAPRRPGQRGGHRGAGRRGRAARAPPRGPRTGAPRVRWACPTICSADRSATTGAPRWASRWWRARRCSASTWATIPGSGCRSRSPTWGSRPAWPS